MDKLLQAQFEKALEKMPMEFTSKMFCTECRKLGTPESSIKNGVAREYLINHALKASQRGWTKGLVWTGQDSQKTIFDDLPCNVECSGGITADEYLIHQAIQTLKKAGYKILMPETTFKEI